jgi:hypothetical protein
VKCECCDKEISDKEIQWNPELVRRDGRVGMFDYCPFCLEVALEAAYSDGYRGEDEEVIIDLGFDDEEDLVYVGANDDD